MLEMKKAAISFEAQELMELERIITDGDEKEALRYLKKYVYDRIAHGQTGRLKSHLDSGSDTVADFHGKNK
jgi:hypothetical protein